FEKAWRERHRYRSDLANFTTWLFTIARNIATDHLRHEQVEQSLVQAAVFEPESMDDMVQKNADIAYLLSLLNELPNRERELVALKYGANLTNRQIAPLVGLSESNVGTVLNRTLNKLREQWEKSHEA